MAKTMDFGGLPSSVFTTILATFSTPAVPGGPTDAEKIAVLAALAAEEHAGANCAEFDTIDAVILSIDVREMHILIASGGAPAGTIGNFVILLDNLRDFWKKSSL